MRRGPVTPAVECLIRLSAILQYFQRSLREGSRVSPGPLAEGAVRAADGACAVFHVEVEGDRIRRSVYRSTACITLAGFCEHLAELAEGMSLGEAVAFEAETLLKLHPEVPPERRDRAALAVEAFRAAAKRASQSLTEDPA
jgi:hypothetical protein